jgi:hypothetical protein
MSMSRVRRSAMSLIAVLILYGNAALIFNPQKLGLPLPNPWPRPFALVDAFLLTGMFTSFTSENMDFVIGGRRQVQASMLASDNKPEWIVLSLNEMLPGRLGIKFTQILAARHWDMLGVKAQHAAWHEAAQKIRARHNRLHPDRPIDAVRFGAMSWPLSADGYRAAKPRGADSKSSRNYADWYNDETYKP